MHYYSHHFLDQETEAQGSHLPLVTQLVSSKDGIWTQTAWLQSRHSWSLWYSLLLATAEGITCWPPRPKPPGLTHHTLIYNHSNGESYTGPTLWVAATEMVGEVLVLGKSLSIINRDKDKLPLSHTPLPTPQYEDALWNQRLSSGTHWRQHTRKGYLQAEKTKFKFQLCNLVVLCLWEVTWPPWHSPPLLGIVTVIIPLLWALDKIMFTAVCQ